MSAAVEAKHEAPAGLAPRRKTEIQVQKLRKRDSKYFFRSSLDFKLDFRSANTFLLLFDKSSTDPRVWYMMLDQFTERPRLLPKCSCAQMPRLKDIYAYRIISVGNTLYLLGGRHAISGSFLNQVFRYDVTSNLWVRRASMRKGRSRFAVVEKDGCIYVLGGDSRHGLLDSVEMYDPRLDHWSHLSSMPRPRADHAACLENHKIFLTGGVGRPGSAHRKNGGTTTFWCYDPYTDHWVWAHAPTTLPWSKERHSMVAFRNVLYCVGGIAFKRPFDEKSWREMEDEAVLEFSLDKHSVDPKITGQWDQVAPPMPTPRAGAGVIVLGHNIYVIGGRSATKKCPYRKIEYYNTRKNKWYQLFDLPEDTGSFWDLDVTFLTIPTSNTEFSSLGRALGDKWVLW